MRSISKGISVKNKKNQIDVAHLDWLEGFFVEDNNELDFMETNPEPPFEEPQIYLKYISRISTLWTLNLIGYIKH
jgi:hypothetical protein